MILNIPLNVFYSRLTAYCFNKLAIKVCLSARNALYPLVYSFKTVIVLAVNHNISILLPSKIDVANVLAYKQHLHVLHIRSALVWNCGDTTIVFSAAKCWTKTSCWWLIWNAEFIRACFRKQPAAADQIRY